MENELQYKGTKGGIVNVNNSDHLDNRLAPEDFFNQLPTKKNVWQMVGMLMDESLFQIKALWKSYFFYFIGYYFFSSIAAFLLILVVILGLGISITGLFSNDLGVVGLIFTFLWVSMLFVILHSFVEGARYGISYIYIGNQQGNKVKAATAISATLKKMFGIFGITFLVDLPLVILSGLTILLFAAMSSDSFFSALGDYFSQLSDTPIYLALALLFIVVLFIGIFLLHEVYRTWVGYALYYYTHEHLKGIEAIKHSIQLVKREFHLYFVARVGISLSMGMLSLLMTWLISGIAIALNMFTAGLWPILSVAISQPLSLFNTVVSLVTMLFCTGCTFVCFADLFYRGAQVKANEVADAQ